MLHKIHETKTNMTNITNHASEKHVLCNYLKTCNELASLITMGREFHSQRAQTTKAWSPLVISLDRGTTSDGTLEHLRSQGIKSSVT